MNYYLYVLQNYATFSGRARRKEYWNFVLINLLISFGLGLIGGMLKMPLLSGAYSVFVIVPSLAAGVRRLHDTGNSGWFLLIPIYNIILLATSGYEGDNEYGPDPKGSPEDILEEIGEDQQL